MFLLFELSSQGSIVKDFGKYYLIMLQCLILKDVGNLKQLSYFVVMHWRCSKIVSFFVRNTLLRGGQEKVIVSLYIFLEELK